MGNGVLYITRGQTLGLTEEGLGSEDPPLLGPGAQEFETDGYNAEET